MTLVELVVSLGVLAVGLLGFLQSIIYAVNLTRAQRETAVVSEIARQTIENLRAATFNQVFRLYNVDPNDDPAGVGTGPGNKLSIAGLRTLPGTTDGAIGHIVFPVRSAGLTSVQVQESVVDSDLGTPRDLNGDGLVDNADHSSDYRILPVVIHFDWSGATGARHMELKTLLADY